MAIDTRPRIGVVVADDHSHYRDGLVRAIADVPELELLAEATDGLEAEALIGELEPEVALVDVKMPALGGIELCERLTHRGLRTRVLMLSAYVDQNLIEHAMSAGAAGYLGKDTSRDNICHAIVRAGREVATAQVP
jgi:two-component system nitrate/nitrite response regulator NarL